MNIPYEILNLFHLMKRIKYDSHFCQIQNILQVHDILSNSGELSSSCKLHNLQIIKQRVGYKRNKNLEACRCSR